MKPISIYALINPINEQVFYIGASKNPSKRIKQHHSLSVRANEFKLSVIREILLDNKQAEMVILDECDVSDTVFWEEFYIDLFKSYGFTLTQSNRSGYHPLMNPDFKVTVSIGIYSKLFAEYETEAKRIDRSISWLFAKAIKEYAKELKNLN